MRRPGLAVTAVLFVLGVTGSLAGTERFWPYTLSAGQIAETVVAVGVLVTLGLLAGRGRRTPGTERRAPGPWPVGAAALAAGLAFRLLPDDWNPWPTVALMLALAALVLAAILYWSAATGWGDRHRLALAAGALLTYAALAFPQTPMIPARPAVDLAGNAIFAAGAVALLLVAARRLRHSSAVGTSPARMMN